MQRWDTVAIIGVGLIGGSIGLALRKRKLASRVVGIGRRRSFARRKALELRLRRPKRRPALPAASREADLVVVCTPVEQIAELIAEAARHAPPGALITDAGSTKAAVVARTEAAAACPVSPAGCRSSAAIRSPAARRPAPRRPAPTCSTAGPWSSRRPAATDDRRAAGDRAILAVARGATSCACRPASTTRPWPARAICRTWSRPPLRRRRRRTCCRLTGSGWRDTTRIAAGDVELWRQIFLANRASTLKALADFETVLARFRTALETATERCLAELLAEGKRRRDAVGS